MAQHVDLYDTTLRDGTQMEGISVSVDDKLKITQRLDLLGVQYIEGGWPGSNPKDAEFFRRAQSLKLKNAQLAAFGSTRRAGVKVEADAQVQALLDARTPVITLVGKSSELQVTRILETTLEENLAMIKDTVAYLKGKGRKVFYDAEHFFDGYRANPTYAVQCLQAAAQAGASCAVLCDTNGGTLPNEVVEIVTAVRKATGIPLGIHMHNDADTAVASSLAAILAGVTQVQGCVNGYGERTGNANMLSIISNLQLKAGYQCVPDEQLRQLTQVARYVAELVNMPLNKQAPYVGESAFVHKGGLHAAAVAKMEDSYQHIKPELVGNASRVLVSELAGRANVQYKLNEMGLKLSSEQVRELVELVKQQESEGYQYEGAEASFELLVKHRMPNYIAPFILEDFRVTVAQSKAARAQTADGSLLAEATVKVTVGGKIFHTVAEGNGPVNALDAALRKALLQFYPSIQRVTLTDYKVRVVDNGNGTGAVVRVLIESTDGSTRWHTVGASTNIIEASWLALQDGLEWWLLRQGVEKV
ncbi:MAG: citramalate synthase [Dehalococcoidia bacterium]|nr:citramalate synthase [Dehalococcoidia bacterium]